MSDQQFMAAMGTIALGIGALAVWKNEQYLKELLVINFEKIGMVGYAVFAGIMFLLSRKYKSWTREFSQRTRLLSKLWSDRSSVYVGETLDDGEVYIPDRVRTGHVQIIGATGRGKTESVVLPWFMQDLARGKSAVLIDGKGERALLERIERYAEPINTKVISFDLGHVEKSAATNPLMMGTAQQITDRIFAAFEFEDPFYKAVQYEITGFVVQGLIESNEVVTFKRLYEVLTEDEKLSELAGKAKSVQARLARWLSESKKDREQKLAGIVSQLGPFAQGEIASFVNGPVEGREFFSLAEMLTVSEEKKREMSEGKNLAVVILLPTLLYQEIAFKLGKMFLQETAWAVAARREKSFTPIFLDEFSSFVYPGFNSILNRARSSGIALHLSHQSLGDLEQVSKDFAKAVNTNTNVKCLLGLNDPDTADFFAKHIGTKGEEKITERGKRGGFFSPRERTGDVSIREVEAYKVHPNRLKNYMSGEGVIQFALPEGTIVEEIKFHRLPAEPA